MTAAGTAQISERTSPVAKTYTPIRAIKKRKTASATGVTLTLISPICIAYQVYFRAAISFLNATQ